MLSSPDRHKSIGALLALCVAATLVVGSGALAMTVARLQRLAQPSGLAETGLWSLHVAGERAGCCRSGDDLAAVRALPGVRGAAIVNQTPYAPRQWRVGIASDVRGLARPDTAAMYAGSDGLLRTMGLHLVAGRDFRADEYGDARPDFVPDRRLRAAILTRALAQRLFGDAPALGRHVYLSADNAPVVVGIVERLAAPPVAASANRHREEDTLLLPLSPTNARGAVWLIRTANDDGARTLGAVAAVLQARGHAIVHERGALDDARQRAMAPHRRAIVAIAIGASLWLLASLASVSTLLSLWLGRLQPTLDLHRALGAGRGRLRRRLHGEVLTVSAIGLALGAPAAWMLLRWLTAIGLAAPPPPPMLAAAAVAVAIAIAMLPQCAGLLPIARATARSPAQANRGAIMRPSLP